MRVDARVAPGLNPGAEDEHARPDRAPRPGDGRSEHRALPDLRSARGRRIAPGLVHARAASGLAAALRPGRQGPPERARERLRTRLWQPAVLRQVGPVGPRRGRPPLPRLGRLPPRWARRPQPARPGRRGLADRRPAAPPVPDRLPEPVRRAARRMDQGRGDVAGARGRPHARPGALLPSVGGGHGLVGLGRGDRRLTTPPANGHPRGGALGAEGTEHPRTQHR